MAVMRDSIVINYAYHILEMVHQSLIVHGWGSGQDRATLTKPIFVANLIKKRPHMCSNFDVLGEFSCC